ncbi:MAG: transposase [Clostridia bacterium]|nr:transposase [Clostridia bacterium]
MADTKNPSIRTLVLITTEKLSVKAIEVFKENGLPLQYCMLAEGTASSEILDLLGLGTSEKRVLVSMLPKVYANRMIKKLHDELNMSSVNSGIAFTLPLTGVNSLFLKLITKDYEIEEASGKNNDAEEGEIINMNEKNYSLVAAIVNRGFSGDIMVVAREAGAGGGTVIHSRELITEESAGFWGANIQEEKEVLLILAETENKTKIMKAISEKYGTRSEANGLVLSLPLDSVIGI